LGFPKTERTSVLGDDWGKKGGGFTGEVRWPLKKGKRFRKNVRGGKGGKGIV